RLRLGEGFRHPLHDLEIALSGLEVVELLREVVFLLTEDDRDVAAFWYAVSAVAGDADAKLGGEFALPCRIRRVLCRLHWQPRDNERSENAQNNLCTHQFPSLIPRSSPYHRRAGLNVARAARAIGAACFLRAIHP